MLKRQTLISDILKKIKRDLKIKKKRYPEEWLGRSLAYATYYPRDILHTLKNSTSCSIISEIKCVDENMKPYEEYDELVTAQTYEQNDSDIISVVTEENFFKGDVELLTAIRRYASLPLIRDDFIIDRYQVLESVVYGADSLILKANMLSKKELKALVEFTRMFGMEPIVEIGSKSDLIKAIFASSDILSINREDLNTNSVDENLHEVLIPLIPNGKVITIKGGIYDDETAKNANYLGVDGYFVQKRMI